jgi:SHS2 domain-containing protein
MGFKLGYHTADLCLVLEDSSFEGLLGSALVGYRFLLVGNVETQTDATEEFTFEAPDRESMLVNFLNRLVFLFETRQFLPDKANFSINGNRLSATVNGSNYHGEVKHCVKAATYHGLEVVEIDGQFTAQVILDD